MQRKKVKIVNLHGLHMRPANELAKAMSAFEADTFIAFGAREINAKSLMNIISAGIKGGCEVEIRCEGRDEEEALAKAVSLISSAFGEEKIEE